MNLIRIIAFIAAVITVVLTSDDILSEKLIKETTASLNNPSTVNQAIKYGFNAVHESLTSLREDYPDFTPEIKHWSEGGSAYLYYLDVGEGLGLFSIRLPDQLIIVDSEGNPQARHLCGSDTADCEVVTPKVPALGITGSFFYATSDGALTPAVDIAAYWERQGQVETLANCIWSFTSDVTEQKLTVDTISNRASPYETKDMYGYYKVVVHFEGDEEKKHAAGYHYAMLERLTKEQFLAYRACNNDVSQ